MTDNAKASAEGPNTKTAVKSMTGYARVQRHTPRGELTISLRSVNHRGLDLHFYQSSEFGSFETAMRAQLKRGLARGHVEVRVSLRRDAKTSPGSYNRELLAQHLAAFREARKEFRLDTEPDLNVLLRLPGVLEPEADAEPLDQAFEPEVTAALGDCVAQLNASRQREGQELRLGVEQEAQLIEAQTRQMLALRAGALPAFQQRIEGRLSELLNGAGIDQRRIIEEAAILADRSDVQEELTRLEIHTRELMRILAEGGEVGKRLDFLLQEMNRETNTILSKTSGSIDAGLAVTNLALATKANIERIREQSLNLE